MRRAWALLALVAPAAPSARALVVCADPNNLPFSDRDQQGFENKLVVLLAGELHESVNWVWWPQRRGFARHTLSESRCDLWPGVASAMPSMQTTHPYYRSTYVFVTRASSPLRGLSLDDPRLRRLRIGVELLGVDAINTPPAQALAERGITQNVRGFMVFGDYSHPNPSAAIVAAVARGEIDVALVWGPLAAYFAAREGVPLRLEPIADDHQWKMSYDISVGVRRDDRALRQRLDDALEAEQPAIAALLRKYRVPQLPPTQPESHGPSHRAF